MAAPVGFPKSAYVQRGAATEGRPYMSAIQSFYKEGSNDKNGACHIDYNYG